jgi:hypothetical protein
MEKIGTKSHSRDVVLRMTEKSSLLSADIK